MQPCNRYRFKYVAYINIIKYNMYVSKIVNHSELTVIKLSR